VHSRTDRGARVASRVVMIAMLLLASPGSTVSATPPGERPSRAEIQRALDALKADSNLATLHPIRMLKWKDSNKPKPSATPVWLTWVFGLFRWLDQSARYLVWGVTVTLVAFLAVYLIRVVRDRDIDEFTAPTLVAPSHVRDLDIRPETLPADIGAAARMLWDRGERRAALALLYRGMLSRFAHVHQLPIRDSSTEGDCLALAVAHLPAPKSDYASRLVREWQRVVYGRENIRDDTVYELCDGFAPALDPGAAA
jgi:Domain of unknown function (DUF4129)